MVKDFSFMIGNLIWKVKFRSHSHPMLADMIDGRCVYKTRSILINNTLKTAKQRETLIHEILHALFVIEKDQDDKEYENTIIEATTLVYRAVKTRGHAQRVDNVMWAIREVFPDLLEDEVTEAANVIFDGLNKLKESTTND